MVGVLALQGAVAEHLAALARIDSPALQVRTKEQLAQVDSLILPGGESTTLAKLLEREGLDQAIRQRALAGMPLWGTCAGMILLATEVVGAIPGQNSLGLVDMRVERNAYGRQLDSFETILEVGPVAAVTAVFIRAPVVHSVGDGVEVLSQCEGRIVAVRSGNILATSFHPELTQDGRLHAYFASFPVNQAVA